MKKILTLFAVVGLITFSSCTGSDGPVGPQGEPGQDGLIAEVFELKNINFVNDGGVYTIHQNLNPVIFDSDVLLIYRLEGTINATTPIWKQIPRTVFTNSGEFDYDFDFSKQDFSIYAVGTYNLALTPQFINNQTFRIVIIPGAFSTTGKSVNKADYSDYNAVIKQYNIDDSNVKRLN